MQQAGTAASGGEWRYHMHAACFAGADAGKRITHRCHVPKPRVRQHAHHARQQQPAQPSTACPGRTADPLTTLITTPSLTSNCSGGDYEHARHDNAGASPPAACTDRL